MSVLDKMTGGNETILQALAFHCSVFGNEQADKLAKQGRRVNKKMMKSEHHVPCSGIGGGRGVLRHPLDLCVDMGIQPEY